MVIEDGKNNFQIRQTHQQKFTGFLQDVFDVSDVSALEIFNKVGSFLMDRPDLQKLSVNAMSVSTIDAGLTEIKNKMVPHLIRDIGAQVLVPLLGGFIAALLFESALVGALVTALLFLFLILKDDGLDLGRTREFFDEAFKPLEDFSF